MNSADTNLDVEDKKQRKTQNTFAKADRIEVRSGLDFEFAFEFRIGLEMVLQEFA